MVGEGNKTGDTEGLMEWCHAHPKIELHAHLNGSIRDSTLLELARDLDKKGLIVLSDVEPAILKSSRTLPECFELFDLFHILATDHGTVRRITKEAVEDFAAENVIYLELRTTPKKNEAKYMTKQSYLDAVIEGLKAVETVDVLLSVANDDHTIQFERLNNICGATKRKKIYIGLLLSIDRRESTSAAMETVDLALKMKHIGIVGVDLSGNPIVGEWQTFLPALEYAKERGLPITIHCGEVHNPAEVQAILEFCPQRIGHACKLDDSHWSKLKSSKIPVEICLTSNIRTNSVSSIDDHHFIDLYNSGHPMALCTDDPGLFSTSLSKEYYLAALSFGLGKRELHQLAKGAVEFSFANDGVKRELNNVFEAIEGLV